MKEADEEKEVVVYTAGTWDLFHIGHLNILKSSKALGTKLIVGISTDEVVKSYKNAVPITPFSDRARLVESCRYVDKVVQQNKILDPIFLESLGIDILTIGDDWKGHFLEGLEWAEKHPHIKLMYLPYTMEISSTQLKNKIKNEWNKR